MQFGISNKKAGVSLVTVLLFMLVATIAATATYKWLTSEGRSSGSRLQKQMAYQSAVAGIDNARAWMTFHANDVGALIKQYKDGNYAPINLDANLRSLQRPGQNHHVWLVGVNTENSAYKLKILSSGEANGGARHSEVAIFNVSGLYQVSLPVQQGTKKKIPFDYAYFGGSYDGAGSLTMTSAIVNGNWYGNPQGIEKKFVVTGNANLTGNNVTIGELACVGGNMSPENNGLVGKDVYVGKTFTGNITSTGNAYFGGDVNPSSAGNFSIGGHVTLMGNLQTVQSAKDLTIGGDLCLAEDAHILSKGTNYTFETKGNVWMPGEQNLWYGSMNYTDCTCERVWCNWMGQCQPKTTVACTGSSKKMEMNGWEWGNATYTLLSCAKSTLVSAGDNYANYNKIIVGGKDKTVYIKTGHPFSDYNGVNGLYNTKKFTETKDEKIMCKPKPGVWRPDPAHEYCNTDNAGKVGPGERWDGDIYYAYDSHTGTGKTGLSYIYQSGVTDVSLDYYNDDYWILCNEWAENTFGTPYCADPAPEAGVNVLTYFVGGKRFWDGYEGVGHERQTLNYEGGKPTGSPYCTNQAGAGKNKFRPKCGVTPWFKTNATEIKNTEPSPKFECSKAVKDSCDVIWEKKPGCGGSDYKVDDVLVTAKAMFEPYANKGCAASITRYDKNLVEKLNACYADNNSSEDKKKNLYNGYLVVKVSGGTNSTNPTGTLNGKFIIIARDALYTKLPQTEANTRVLLYLEKGANTLNDVTVSNYFIYTEGNIGSGNQFNLTGTIYATAESCAGLGKLQSSSITYNQELVNDLSEAGVICPNDGSVCGGTGGTGSSGGDPSGSGSGESTEESSTTGGTDAYYISMAPQLGVTLESQYENDEPLPTGNNQAALDPSFIVLPRVIYLPSDPFGELKDYYNVIPLNGSTLKKTDVSVSSCIGASGSLSTTGKLYTGTHLPQGIYSCAAKAGGYSDVPFWVVVGNSHRDGLPITFVETDQKIAAGGTKEVHVVIPPNTAAVDLLVYCPVQNEDDDLKYTLDGGTVEGTTCKFSVQGDASGSKTQRLFMVTAKAGAQTGSVMFQLLSGTGYSIGSPYTSQVYMASIATLERKPATDDEINAYCADHPGICPPAGKRDSTAWPNCYPTETWVEPTGITYGTISKNFQWNLVVGGSGTLQLAAHDVTNCVAIVPTENNSIDISTINVETPQYLRASLKALKKTIQVTFVGQVSTNPEITIDVDGTTSTCKYDDSGDNKTCEISAFSGQTVSLSIDKDLDKNSKFNYWSCSGISCPTTEAISSEDYNAFTIKDDNSVVYAHFNEADKHCFFDEFKNGTVTCYSEDTVYCINKCGADPDAVCVGATDVTTSKSKWHLISGKHSDIDVVAGSISLHRNGRAKVDPVTVMSTVNAGTYGTLKALFQLPKETASHNRNAVEISKSGFLLRSNNTGSEYLMLNMFANQSGYLEAQLCSNNGNCLSGTLLKGGNPASVYTSNMIMMSATLAVNGNLSISAFTGNYYGTPDEYSVVFNVSDLGTTYTDVAHEFVGFGLADPNFKLYGVGWKSDTYSAECHDYYPTVKCSFAAVATDGVIPTATTEDAHYITPWIGHSGWYDSKKYSCTEKYYYYNGNDACGGASGATPVECTSSGYSFAESGAGQHGYVDNDGNDVKTAKAWLNCTLNNEEIAWTKETKNERAHCGPFWTGKIQECSEHVAVTEANNRNISANQELTVTLTDAVNLRATTLAVEMVESSGIDVEIWLMSDNETWGAMGYASKSVVLTSQKGSFSVDDAMNVGVDGFDPENVTQIIFKNRGNAAVTVKSVIASCKKAVDISDCSANYADGKWTVLVGVQNKENVSSYGVEAKVDNATVFEVSATNPNSNAEGKVIIEQADNPYAEYQGKSYKFYASIVNKTGSTASKECSVTPSTIGSITVGCNVTGSPKKQGEGLPQFHINIGSGCPVTGCSYEVYVGNVMLDGYPANHASGTIDLPVPEGNGLPLDDQGNSLTADYDVGTYKYRVKSPDTATYPFGECEASFEIKKKDDVNNSALKTECWFSNSTPVQPGANANFKAYIKSHGYDISNRNYELRNSSGQKVKEGTTNESSELSFDISGVNTLKDGTFSLYVKDNGSFSSVASCTAELNVNELSPTCSKVNENGQDYFKFNFTQICSGSACTYNVKKTYGGTTTSITGGNQTLSQNETKVAMSGFGSYVLWLNDEETTCSVNVVEPDPAFTCPANLQAIVGKTDNVTITPANVSGCDNGCSYTIAGTSVTNTNFEYHFGALPAFTNNTNTVGSTAKYEVSLTNNKTTVKHECEVAFIAEPVIPIDNPGQVACYSDGNYNWGSNSVKIKIDNYDGAYGNKSYVVKDASGNNSLATGTTSTNQQIEIQMPNTYYATDSKLRVFIAGSEVCSVTPRVKKPYLKDCKPNGTNKVHFDIQQCENSQCKYQVKKSDGTVVNTETNGSGGIDVSISGKGDGIYVVWLNGEETSCRIPMGTSMTIPAHCYFPQARKWGEQESQLKMDNPGQFMKNKTYVVKDAADNKYAESSNNTGNDVVDMSLSSYYATDVTLYVYVGSTLYCTVDPITYGPYTYSCKLDNYTITSGNSTTFRFGIGDCDNSKCSYIIKRDGTQVKKVDDIGENGGYTYTVSDAGTYVVWLNGKETGCRVTLTVH